MYQAKQGLKGSECTSKILPLFYKGRQLLQTLFASLVFQKRRRLLKERFGSQREPNLTFKSSLQLKGSHMFHVKRYLPCSCMQCSPLNMYVNGRGPSTVITLNIWTSWTLTSHVTNVCERQRPTYGNYLTIWTSWTLTSHVTKYMYVYISLTI